LTENALQPSADWDWVWDWDWVTQGSRLGHAWATQASRLGLPWVESRKCFVYNEDLEMPGGGGKIAGIADIARYRKTKPFNHKGHPFDSPFASSGLLRAGSGTRKGTLG